MVSVGILTTFSLLTKKIGKKVYETKDLETKVKTINKDLINLTI